jgi:hypothetical protein
MIAPRLLAAGDPARSELDEVRLDVGVVVEVASAFRMDPTGPEVSSRTG